MFHHGFSLLLLLLLLLYFVVIGTEKVIHFRNTEDVPQWPTGSFVIHPLPPSGPAQPPWVSTALLPLFIRLVSYPTTRPPPPCNALLGPYNRPVAALNHLPLDMALNRLAAHLIARWHPWIPSPPIAPPHAPLPIKTSTRNAHQHRHPSSEKNGQLAANQLTRRPVEGHRGTPQVTHYTRRGGKAGTGRGGGGREEEVDD